MSVVIEELEIDMAAAPAQSLARGQEAEEGEPMQERQVLEAIARANWLAERVAAD